jgi:N-acetylglucosamine-6-sulfatase
MRPLRAVIVSLVLVLFIGAGCGAGDADRDAGIAGPGSNARPGEAGRARSADDRPNIVFVMTDDMEEKMLSRMPVVRSRIMDEGVTFDNAFVTQSLCCPSRASTPTTTA